MKIFKIFSIYDFMVLETNQYVRENLVETSDSRWNIFDMTPLSFKFYDIIQGPENSFDNEFEIKKSENISTDGVNFTTKESRTLYRSHFFLTKDMMLHSRISRNILSIFSDFGGLMGIIFPVAIFLSSPISYNTIMNELITKMYF